MRDVLWLIAFLALTLGGGLGIGFWARPDGWYAHLNKPSFNPPDWVFGPVWTVLYVMVAIAGYRVFGRAPGGAAMILWAVGLALNFMWSPAFFRLRAPALALAVVLSLLAVNVAFFVSMLSYSGITTLTSTSTWTRSVRPCWRRPAST